MIAFLKNVRVWQWMLLAGLVGLSVSTWYFLYVEHLTLVYNDARSYLNISRSVMDSQQPGMAQIGGVWLPLIHILKLPFIWSEWAWHSGFAGSFLSMASYVLAVVGVFLTTFKLTGVRLAAVVAGAVAALNANFLYLQSTPLVEPLYLMLLVWSVFFLVLYLKTSALKYVLPLAFLAALQIMTRYDGWFVAAVVAAIVLGHELWVRRLALQKAFGQLLLFVAPVAFACLLWFGWNAIIFGNPLYFINGPSSAHAQQEIIDNDSGLITKGDLGTSFEAYGYAVVGNIGWWVLGISLVGWIVYLATTRYREWRVPLAVFGALFAIFVFNVLSLFLGFSSLNVPELNWNNSTTVEPLFNVRYGILMLPLVAIGAGLLVAKWRYAAGLIVGLVAFQGVAMVQEKPITLRDGQYGASAFVEHGMARELGRHVERGDDVLLSMSVFNPVAFESGIELKQIVHEGIEARWQPALTYPEGSMEWIVMGVDDSDPIYRTLHDGPAIQNNYRLVYHDQYGSIYQLVGPTAAIAR